MKLVWLTWMWCSLAHASEFHVLIDPGHGGVDRGAVRGEMRESDIALQVSHEVGRLLKADPRFRVNFTRERDVSVALNRRAQMAQELRADMMISIHLNSNEEQHLSGPEFYFQSIMATDEYAQFLANRENLENGEAVPDSTAPSSNTISAREDVAAIVTDLKHNGFVKYSGEFAKALHGTWLAKGHHNHRVKQAPFYVISQGTAPSVLIELGYISNPNEAKQLADPTYQRQLAQHIYQALVTYKETLDKSHPRRLD